MRIETAQNVGIEYEVAGLGDRVLAALADYFILFCAFVSVSVTMVWFESAALYLAFLMPLFLYFPLCEVFFEGQSIGKRWRRIRVARVDGAAPTLGNYVLRWLLRLVEVDLTFGTVAFVAVLAGGRWQRLGDLAAGTTVVKVQPRVAFEETIFADVEPGYRPTFPEVDRLSDGDVETAKEVLRALVEEGRSRTAFVMGTRIKSALEARMGVSSDLTPPLFLRAVIRDYNHVHGRL